VRARLCGALIALVTACGARTGLEIAPTVDAAHDGGLDAALDGGLDAAEPSRCPIGLDDTVAATITMTADDNYRLFVNGMLVDETPRVWHEVQRYASVPIFRHPSRRNVVAIEGINLFRIDGRDRGVIAQLALPSGRTLVTDGTWRTSTSLAGAWTAVDFDASAWSAPFDEGVDGIDPWGNLLGSSAHWLWSYDSNIPATAKPEEEHVAFRRAFFLDLDGAIQDEPGPCP
jgi:hypothetical protein